MIAKRNSSVVGKHNNIDLVNVMPLKTSNQIVSKNKLSITNNKLRLHPDM